MDGLLWCDEPLVTLGYRTIIRAFTHNYLMVGQHHTSRRLPLLRGTRREHHGT
jgi:hypothetical protein